jgi:hypothetical protein
MNTKAIVEQPEISSMGGSIKKKSGEGGFVALLSALYHCIKIEISMYLHILMYAPYRRVCEKALVSKKQNGEFTQ